MNHRAQNETPECSVISGLVMTQTGHIQHVTSHPVEGGDFDGMVTYL